MLQEIAARPSIRNYSNPNYTNLLGVDQPFKIGFKSLWMSVLDFNPTEAYMFVYTLRRYPWSWLGQQDKKQYLYLGLIS